MPFVCAVFHISVMFEALRQISVKWGLTPHLRSFSILLDLYLTFSLRQCIKFIVITNSISFSLFLSSLALGVKHLTGQRERRQFSAALYKFTVLK